MIANGKKWCCAGCTSAARCVWERNAPERDLLPRAFDMGVGRPKQDVMSTAVLG